eukprot:31297-Pelagococcus_subviridis.AAC.1
MASTARAHPPGPAAKMSRRRRQNARAVSPLAQLSSSSPAPGTYANESPSAVDRLSPRPHSGAEAERRTMGVNGSDASVTFGHDLRPTERLAQRREVRARGPERRHEVVHLRSYRRALDVAHPQRQVWSVVVVVVGGGVGGGGGVAAFRRRVVVVGGGSTLGLVSARVAREAPRLRDAAIQHLRPHRYRLRHRVREPLRRAPRGVDDDASPARRRRLRDVRVQPRRAEAPVVVVPVRGLEVARPRRHRGGVGVFVRLVVLVLVLVLVLARRDVPRPASEVREHGEPGESRAARLSDERRVVRDAAQAVVYPVVVLLQSADNLVDVLDADVADVVRVRGHGGVRPPGRGTAVGSQ